MKPSCFHAERNISDQIVISGLHVIPGVFSSKQFSFLAHRNVREIAYLTACSQPVAKCKQNPNQQGRSRTHQVPSVHSSDCGSLPFHWEQLGTAPKKQIWRQVLFGE